MTRRAWTDFMATRHIQQPLFRRMHKTSRNTRRHIEPREVDIQRTILQALRMHPNVARIERTNSGSGRFVSKNGKICRFVRYGFRGQADLTGVARDGRIIAIEVKRPQTRNRLSLEQAAYLSEVLEAGGYAGVATSVEEALAIVEGRCRA